jgi:hypothetical protein
MPAGIDVSVNVSDLDAVTARPGKISRNFDAYKNETTSTDHDIAVATRSLQWRCYSYTVLRHASYSTVKKAKKHEPRCCIALLLSNECVVSSDIKCYIKQQVDSDHEPSSRS